ncbi:hypothetical protein BHU16_10500 [Tannerella sp. oral taxon 808]|nr:hypothetical protein BHU16_10500 [Tannerella sp. oral taxon 808]
MTQRKKEFSYYRLRLASYLKDYHPERLADEAFIRDRSDAAAQAYEDAFRQGYPVLEAGYIATEVLFAGLHFSPYYMLEQIIENEFANVVPPDRIEAVALRLLQSEAIRKTIAKYNPGDDFDGSPEYDQLYTELTGVIVELLEADGVKVLP